MGRQSRLRRLRRSGEVRNAAWAGATAEPKSAPDLVPENPYSSDEEVETDRQILKQAWMIHFHLAEVPEDFLPAMFVEDDEGMAGAPWMAVFRDLLIDKYGSLDEAEPRFRYIVGLLIPEMADRAVDGIRASDAPPLEDA